MIHQITVHVLATLVLALLCLATPTSTLNPCSNTPYPHLCANAVSHDAMLSTLRHTLVRVSKTHDNFRRIAANVDDDVGLRKMRALDDCLDLMEQTIFQLNTSIARVTDIRELRAQLSASATTQRTCTQVLQQAGLARHAALNRGLVHINRHISNALAMAAAQEPSSSDSDYLSEYGLSYPMREDGYPEWMSEDDQKLLLAEEKDSYDIVVAQDGSGKFTSISDAVNAAPSGSQKRFVIYIKAGNYSELVEIKQEKTNIMFLGDGMGKTVIRGNPSHASGFSIHTGVLKVIGNGFIAKGITVENYAGPEGGQAVALLSKSDNSAFYQCSILGYQDTLFTVAFRQFYRDCDIYGTMDFIFGNPSAVFQRCNIYLRKPKRGGADVVTAMSRGGPTETTAMSFIESNILAAPDLDPHRDSVRSFLGRPWQPAARVVYMMCKIGDAIDPAGWGAMSGDPSTFKDLYFGEYMNNGPGADTKNREKWPGVKLITDPKEAAQFTAGALINADQWLKGSGIPYFPGLNHN
uniref:pectinesterase n=1 Tax=Kalanchoe fedtschenkoi TaxID=63787 RepID=A0A7N0ZWD9_KALFE